METSVLVTLRDLFTSVLGPIPPEFEGLFWLVCCIFLFWGMGLVFQLFLRLFEVVFKWKH